MPITAMAADAAKAGIRNSSRRSIGARAAALHQDERDENTREGDEGPDDGRRAPAVGGALDDAVEQGEQGERRW